MTRQDAEKLLTETLEKGRRPDPIGTRKIQEKTEKDGSKIRYWRKKTAKGWEYDGLVSEAEYKAFMTSQRKVKKLTKLKEETRKKVEEAESGNKKQAQQIDYKPSAAELAKMPKKKQMYWSDPNVTDSRRKLCDATGILTLDDAAENYVRGKMNTVFNLSQQQQDVINDVDLDFPMDADGKAFDDPLFMDDAADRFKLLKEELMTDKAKKERERLLSDEWNTMDRWTQDNYGSLQEYLKKSTEALEQVLDDYIDALERHDNDRILAGKLHAYDKGIRGIRAASTYDTAILSSLFGEVPGGRIASWSSLPDAMKKLLSSYGLDEQKWDMRRWGAEEAYAFAMASVNSSFRDEVFMPWLQLTGNVVTDKITRNRAHWSGSTSQMDNWVPREATVSERIDTEVVKVHYNTDLVKESLNPKTVEFMNEAFDYGPFDTDVSQLAMGVANLLQEADKFRTDTSQVLFDGFRAGSGIRNNGLPFDSFISFQNPKSDDSTWGMAQSITWRDFANGIKEMSRRKEFNTQGNEAFYEAIYDAGKALGNTKFKDTSRSVVGTMQRFVRDMTKAMQGVVNIPGETQMQRIMNYRGYSGRHGSKVAAKNGWNNHTVYTGNRFNTSDKKTAPNSFVIYEHFRKSAKIHKTGTINQKPVSLAAKEGGAKAALRSKFMTGLATLGDVYSSNRIARGVSSHVAKMLTLNLGLNWQLRKITKNEDVVPDFKIHRNLVPLSKTSLFSFHGFAGTSGWGGSDSQGRKLSLDADTFNTLMKEHYQDSVADTLGISLGQTVQIGGKANPKIVLRTNAQPISDWQNKLDSDWTHHITGNWQKGAIKVNNVFDIMYHDYFDNYKSIEQSKGNVDYMYHGTDFKAAASIIQGGYKIGRIKAGRAFGDGVYFAKSSSKSAGYLHSGGWGRGSGHTGVLLWNRIAKGTETDPKNPNVGIHDRQYDTVYAGGKTGASPTSWLQHDEWCVKNPKAAVPIQWIEVEAR